MLHVFPHWNLSGQKTVDLWVYSNCEEVKLTVNGKNLGRKPVPKDGHLSWKADYRPGKVVAEGYNKGKRVLREVLETTGAPEKLVTEVETVGELTVVNVSVLDAKGRLVPDARTPVHIRWNGTRGRFLGAGNGDPSYLGPEQPQDGRTLTMPAFNGRLQILLTGPAEDLQLDL